MRKVNPMRRATQLIPISIVVLVVAAVGSTAAQAAPTSRTLSPFCQKAVDYTKSSLGKNLYALKPATLEADYKNFKAASSGWLSLAPGSIKPDLQKILAFDDGLFSALAKADWTFAKIPPATLKTWSVEGPKLKPDSDVVISYLDKTCGLKEPLP